MSYPDLGVGGRRWGGGGNLTSGDGNGSPSSADGRAQNRARNRQTINRQRTVSTPNGGGRGDPKSARETMGRASSQFTANALGYTATPKSEPERAGFLGTLGRSILRQPTRQSVATSLIGSATPLTSVLAGLYNGWNAYNSQEEEDQAQYDREMAGYAADKFSYAPDDPIKGTSPTGTSLSITEPRGDEQPQLAPPKPKPIPRPRVAPLGEVSQGLLGAKPRPVFPPLILGTGAYDDETAEDRLLGRMALRKKQRPQSNLQATLAKMWR